MAGKISGLFCYICELVDLKGNIIGEGGKGSHSIGEKGNPNIAIKIAEKRAKTDAVLSTGGLSDFFTQDLEDIGVDQPQTRVTVVAPIVNAGTGGSGRCIHCHAVGAIHAPNCPLNASKPPVCQELQSLAKDTGAPADTVAAYHASKAPDGHQCQYAKVEIDGTPSDICGAPITIAEAKYSLDKYGVELCRTHQKISIPKYRR